MTEPTDPTRVLHLGETSDLAEALEDHDDRLDVRAATSVDGESGAVAEVDCVVAAYDLPDGTGLDVLETVRESAPDLPFVLSIDEEAGGVASEALSAGATDYFRRGSDTDARLLANRIRTVVDGPAAIGHARDRYESLIESSGAIIFTEDFSEFKRRLDQLAVQAENLDTYFEDHPETVAELMNNVEIVDVTDRALEYYEASSKADLIENLQDRFTEEAYEANKQICQRLAQGETEFRVRSVTEVPSGQRKQEIIDVSVPDHATDDLSRVYLTITEITERVRRERKLEAQNERLEQFASIVSHDLRNPLDVASIRLELLAEEYDSEHIPPIERAHDRMDALVDDLLRLARADERVIDRTELDLATLASGCWETVETGGATLVTDMERAGTMSADESQLRQLFENLIRNAIEHGSTSNRTDTADAQQDEQSVTVRIGTLEDGFYIEDDGPGIPQPEREKIFDAGYSSSQEGTGFGLSIVERVVDAHGWEIDVTEGSDDGTRFEITGVEFVATSHGR